MIPIKLCRFWFITQIKILVAIVYELFSDTAQSSVQTYNDYTGQKFIIIGEFGRRCYTHAL